MARIPMKKVVVVSELGVCITLSKSKGVVSVVHLGSIGEWAHEAVHGAKRCQDFFVRKIGNVHVRMRRCLCHWAPL